MGAGVSCGRVPLNLFIGRVVWQMSNGVSSFGHMGLKISSSSDDYA